MARFKAVCPSCRGKFAWDPSDGLPSRCPLPDCDYVAEDKGEVVISAPFIRSPRMKATDNCYRQLEHDSEVRTQMAADKLGVPVAELSHMKVTNLRDNVAPGETYAMPVKNAVTEQMDRMARMGQGLGGFQGNPDLSGATGKVMVDGKQVGSVEPRAGMRAMETIQSRFNK